MGARNQVSRKPKTQPSRKQCVLVHCHAEKCKSQKLFPQVHESDCFGLFCGCSSKTSTVCYQWTRWRSPSKQGSYSQTVSTSCDKQVCTHCILWRQHYVMTSKEYLTDSHILYKYFEMSFLQLHLVKMSCKLIIIWLNYERSRNLS